MRYSLSLLGFFLLGFAIYGSSLSHPFLFDDEEQVVLNQHIRSLDFSRLFQTSSFNSGGAKQLNGNYYKPLMTSFYAIIYSLAELNPWAYRLPQLVLHIFSAFLILLLFEQGLAWRGALALSLIFLVHPVNAEVVNYVADAQDVFYMFFGLLALFLCQRAPAPWGLGPILISLTLSLLSKETGALFFPIACVYASFFRREFLRPLLLSSLLIGISYGLWRYHLDLTRFGFDHLLFHRASYLERLQTVPAALWHYIEIYFFPSRLSLTADFVVERLTLKEFWLPVMGVLGFLWILVQLGRRVARSASREIGLFFFTMLFFWFVLHGQVLIALDGVYADRWFYLGTVAMTGLLVWTLNYTGLLQSRFFYAVLASVVVLLSARSFARSLDWRDGLTLYSRELRIHPDDALMNNNLGVELFRVGQLEEALRYFQRSVELNPHWSISWNNLGAAIQKSGPPARALEYYRKSMELSAYARAFENYALLMCQLNRLKECFEFVRDEAAPRFPENALFRDVLNYFTKNPP